MNESMEELKNEFLKLKTDDKDIQQIIDTYLVIIDEHIETTNEEVVRITTEILDYLKNGSIQYEKNA